MKKYLYSATVIIALLFSSTQVEASNFNANQQFKKDVSNYGIYSDELNETGVVYAMYQDFDNNSRKDLYYLKLVNNEFKENIYMNDELVYQNTYPMSGGLNATTRLNILYKNGQLWRGYPAYTRAWDGDGIEIQKWMGNQFTTVIDLYAINDDPSGEIGMKYYSNGNKISKKQFESLYYPYKSFQWSEIIKGVAGYNLGYDNSSENVQSVLNQMQVEEAIFKDGRRFKDVPKSSEIYSAIETLIDYNAISSNAYTYNPNNPVTRGQASKMIAYALQLGIVNDRINFKDIPQDNYYYPYVATMKVNKIMHGVSNDLFGVNQTLTRGQMALILTRALDLPMSDTNYKFIDVKDPIIQTSINQLAAAKIINTSTDKFYPNNPVTRGQMALFLSRTIDFQNK